MIENFWIGALVGLGAGVVYASFFEWVLHRFLMHRPLLGFRYAFQAHALVHHRRFKADETYHLIDEQDKHTIPMAWWNGPVLIVLSGLPFLVAAFFTGGWGLVAGAVTAIAAYYGTYEYLHWCMHLPKSRLVEQSWLFRRLNGHHLLHHRYMGNNFNVVLPLADLCLGTLMLRSRVTFAQARCPALPDVQPRQPRIRLGIPRG